MVSATKSHKKNTERIVFSKPFTSFIEKNESRIKDVADKLSDYIIDARKIGYDKARERVINWLANFDKIDFSN